MVNPVCFDGVSLRFLGTEFNGMDERKRQKHLSFLNKTIDRIVRKTQKEILDNTQCAVEGKDRWNAVRSRILGSTNNAARELKKELQRNWEVKHAPEIIHEDVIEVKPLVKDMEHNSTDGKEES